MFGFNTIQKLGAALVVAFLLSGGAYVWGRLDGKALTDAAVERALAEARQSTENAINELADEADKARVRRRLCIDGGGVWSFANNKCLKAEAES
ncbi:molecular chaperone [Roseibium album]|uniref:molecular chaperone n=1 Tax=Roseibium album TaxID=311410 RepID=UPI003BB0B7C8